LNKTHDLEKLKSRCDHLLSRYTECTKDEIDELVKSTAIVFQTTMEKQSEMIETLEEKIEAIEWKHIEMDLLNQAYESFLRSNGLEQEFEDFVKETIAAVEYKHRKQHLTRVK
jgi:DNA-binding NarL/FixJ family response regulator